LLHISLSTELGKTLATPAKFRRLRQISAAAIAMIRAVTDMQEPLDQRMMCSDIGTATDRASTIVWRLR